MKKLHWAIKIRKTLLIKGSWKWNAWVRDITANLEVRFKHHKVKNI